MKKSNSLIENNQGLAIVGLGVIGGSIAGSLKSKGYGKVMGIDKEENTIEEAIKKGYIDSGSIYPQEMLVLADIVIVCLYPQDTIGFIKENMKYFKKNAIITDVSGIKKEIIDDIYGWLRKDLEFVGGHPMSGNHSKGINYSDPNMFNECSYIITPTEINSVEAINRVKSLAMNLGCKAVLEISAKEHDEGMTIASHMPHILALALMNIYDPNIGGMLGPSFKDATRVAQINSKLWAELFISNRVNLNQQIGLMQEKMEELREVILNSDINRLELIMDNAKKKREKII